MNIEKFLAHFADVKKTGPNQWEALCPAHKDTVPSLAIGLDEETILLCCHAGCKTPDVVRKAGLSMSDLSPNKSAKSDKVVKTYDYVDERGQLLFQVCRKSPKGFTQRQPDDNGGWIYNLKGVRRVLYRLPELLKADPNEIVWIVEGEKDADRLIGLGLVATTNPGGAGKWRPEYNEPLQGRKVVILPDHDPDGVTTAADHGSEVAASLKGVVAGVRTLNLPGLVGKEDVSNWLDGGHTVDELLGLIEETQDGSENALKQCLETIHKWLLLPDDSAVLYLLALVVANRLPGDPVWGFIVAPSGGAKTELLNALNDVPEIYPISDLTPQTFISGYMKDPKASLLMKLDDGKILTLKDFTTVLQLNRDSRQQILSQLREIADGAYAKEFGTGQRIAWQGKLGFIAGVTPVIDHHKSVYAVLGERFLQIRPTLPSRKALAGAARKATGKEKLMRKELREAMARCIASVNFERIPEWPDEFTEALDCLATLCAIARSGVVRDGSYSKDLLLIPEPEVPTRLIKQLMKLGQALAMLQGREKVKAEDYDIVRKVATDTISHTRWTILKTLMQKNEPVETSEIATTVGLPTTTAKRHLEDLEGLHLVVGDRPGVGKANKWSLHCDCVELIAKSLTSPRKLPHGEVGESIGNTHPPSTSVVRFQETQSDLLLQPDHELEEVGVPF